MYVHHVIFHYHLFKNKFNTCYCFLPFHLIISHVSSIYLLVWNFVQLITTLKRRKHKLFGHETLGQVHRSCTLPCQWTWRCPWPADLVPQPAALHACFMRLKCYTVTPCYTTSYFASCLKIQFGTPSSQDWMVASVICHSRSSCSISRPQSPFVHSSPKVALHHKEYLGRRLNSTLPSNHCLNVSQIHKYLHTSRIWSVTRRSESWQTEALMVNCITCVLKTKIGFELVKTCAAFPLCHISDSLRYFHSVFTHVTCEICQ